MKKNLPYLLLIIAIPVCLFIGAMAQESAGDAAGKDTTSIEKREGAKADSAADKEAKNPGKEGAAADNKAADDMKKAAAKKAAAKKKEVKKQPEKKQEEKKKEAVNKVEKKEEIPEESLDRESGDSLLMIDHEGIKYNRIPDITVKAEEPGQDLVRIPDDKITDKEEKAKTKGGGIFGAKTDTIARWGLLIFLFVIFIIYKARAKKTRRKGSRIITKR